MRHALRLHPDSVCRAVTRIDVDVVREDAGTLVLHYVVTGQTDDLMLPPILGPARTDELWRHTCFEAFVWDSRGAVYYEFNFAASTQWAAYRFDSYRSGMHVLTGMSVPRIDVQTASGHFTLHAVLELGALPDLPPDAWLLGLSAVIEEEGGRKSYWALAHPPGKPDFHHADGFVCEVS
jgi:hypothetical protein